MIRPEIIPMRSGIRSCAITITTENVLIAAIPAIAAAVIVTMPVVRVISSRSGGRIDVEAMSSVRPP